MRPIYIGLIGLSLWAGAYQALDLAAGGYHRVMAARTVVASNLCEERRCPRPALKPPVGPLRLYREGVA